MKKVLVFALTALMLCACSRTPARPASNEPSAVAVALYDQEDYTPTGKYAGSFFGQGGSVLAEFTVPVPDFLLAEQQEAYVDAMTLWRAFTVETGFELNNNRMYELAGKTYYRDLHYDTYADFADHLRTRFSYELYNALRTACLPDESDGASGLALTSSALYVECDTRLYVLPAQAQGECPWPDSFEPVQLGDTEAEFLAVYPDGTQSALRMERTDTGWQFTEFTAPYHLA